MPEDSSSSPASSFQLVSALQVDHFWGAQQYSSGSLPPCIKHSFRFSLERYFVTEQKLPLSSLHINVLNLGSLGMFW